MSAKAERFWPDIPEHLWDRIRDEFTMPAEAELEAHFRGLGQPDAMRRAVRVFIGDGAFCPGFQMRDGILHEPVLRLFGHALALKVPHNIFAAWMVSPLAGASGERPVDLPGSPLLEDALAAFADRYRPIPGQR